MSFTAATALASRRRYSKHQYGKDGKWCLAAIPPDRVDQFLAHAPILVYEQMNGEMDTKTKTKLSQFRFGHTQRLKYVLKFHLVFPSVQQIVLGSGLHQVCPTLSLFVVCCFQHHIVFCPLPNSGFFLFLLGAM